MDPISHFHTLARYHQWATDRLLAAVADVDDDAYRRDLGLFFKSVHGTLNHLVVAESMLWFERFAAARSPQVALNAEVETDRGALAARLREGAARWVSLVAQWPAERFDATLDYTTMRGTAASLPFAATLAHVFNHATHHRGQITAALTRLGQPSPELDLVYFLQQDRA